MKKLAVGVASVAVFLAACGGGTDPAVEEAAAAELQAAQEEAASLTSELEKRQSELDQTAAELAESSGEVKTLTETVASVESDLATAERERDDAIAERDAATAEAVALRQQYDPEIRASLQAEVDAEISRATADAVENYDDPITVDFDSSWEPIISEQELLDFVTAAAAPERSKGADEREAERLSSYETINVDQVIKNPDAYSGTGVLMWARIVQYDAATGVCSFQANFLGYQGGRFDYDERGQFGYGEDALAQSLNLVCPDLDGIDQDDTIKVWATGGGSFSYSTRNGGTNTIPLFSIEKVELISKG
jgi:Skp family chaperone for outer membrane proteins